MDMQVFFPGNKKVHALVYYRPGVCTPKLRYDLPCNGKAAAVEVVQIMGLFFVIL